MGERRYDPDIQTVEEKGAGVGGASTITSPLSFFLAPPSHGHFLVVCKILSSSQFYLSLSLRSAFKIQVIKEVFENIIQFHQYWKSCSQVEIVAINDLIHNLFRSKKDAQLHN